MARSPAEVHDYHEVRGRIFATDAYNLMPPEERGGFAKVVQGLGDNVPVLEQVLEALEALEIPKDATVASEIQRLPEALFQDPLVTDEEFSDDELGAIAETLEAAIQAIQKIRTKRAKEKQVEES